MNFINYLQTQDKPTLLHYVRSKSKTDVVQNLQDTLENNYTLLENNNEVRGNFIFIVELILMRSASAQKRVSVFDNNFYSKLERLFKN